MNNDGSMRFEDEDEIQRVPLGKVCDISCSEILNSATAAETISVLSRCPTALNSLAVALSSNAMFRYATD